MLAFAGGLAALTLVRILVLFVSPLELYPDEAQYWLWSRHLAFGYFSKPPMIAWLIRATTTLGGQGEAWVRLSAPLSHGLAAIGFAFAGRRLYDLKTGLLGGTIYSLCPGVQLSSAVIATDAPLMVWLAVALWAYALWWRAKNRREALAGAAGFGLALGFALLSKYAALYFAGAAVLHALLSRETRRRWRAADLTLAIGLVLLVALPNAIWNATHHFQTLTHTAANADLGEDGERHGLFDLRGGPGYIVGQFGVFGPLAFTAFVGGAILAWRTRRLETADILLLLFAAPPLLIVLVEAVVSRANANWAGAAYGPAAILTAALLIRWRARRTAAAILISQGLLAAIFLAVFARPGLADHVGLANSFKRARGWAETAQMIEAEARDAGKPLYAIAVDDRFLFNAMAYYARSSDGTPAAGLGAPLRMWVREAVGHNQAETAAPLDAAYGRRVLVANATPHYRREMIADFQRVAPTLTLEKVRLDKTHDREIALFVAEDFHRQPRDPRTGRPFRH
jgi:4-amino-4-deoxy-L-arabinose transferase-like glycosyltransferase